MMPHELVDCPGPDDVALEVAACRFVLIAMDNQVGAEQFIEYAFKRLGEDMGSCVNCVYRLAGHLARMLAASAHANASGAEWGRYLTGRIAALQGGQEQQADESDDAIAAELAKEAYLTLLYQDLPAAMEACRRRQHEGLKAAEREAGLDVALRESLFAAVFARMQQSPEVRAVRELQARCNALREVAYPPKPLTPEELKQLPLMMRPLSMWPLPGTPLRPIAEQTPSDEGTDDD